MARHDAIYVSEVLHNKTSVGSSRNCSFFEAIFGYCIMLQKKPTTVFFFISTRKWIGKSSLSKLYGFFLYLLYFEAFFGNSNMLWKKPRQLYFTSLTLFFTSLLEDGRENSKEVLQTPPLPPGGVQSMICPSGDHPKAKTFPTTSHMTLQLSQFLRSSVALGECK